MGLVVFPPHPSSTFLDRERDTVVTRREMITLAVGLRHMSGLRDQRPDSFH